MAYFYLLIMVGMVVGLFYLFTSAVDARQKQSGRIRKSVVELTSVAFAGTPTPTRFPSATPNQLPYTPRPTVDLTQWAMQRATQVSGVQNFGSQEVIEPSYLSPTPDIYIYDMLSPTPSGEIFAVEVFSYHPPASDDYCLTYDYGGKDCTSLMTSNRNWRELDRQAYACPESWLGYELYIPEIGRYPCLDTGTTLTCVGSACRVAFLDSTLSRGRTYHKAYLYPAQLTMKGGRDAR